MPLGEKFSTVKYQSDAAGVYSLRLSTDFQTAPGNTAITAAFTDKTVKVSVSDHGNKRKSGIHARGLVLGLPAVAPATGYTARSFMPCPSLTAYNAFAKGGTITITGLTWEILDKIQEA